jgi:hypothetical protein
VDKYDTLEYSRVKATTVFVRLRIYLCAFKNTNRMVDSVQKVKPQHWEVLVVAVGACGDSGGLSVWLQRHGGGSWCSARWWNGRVGAAWLWFELECMPSGVVVPRRRRAAAMWLGVGLRSGMG